MNNPEYLQKSYVLTNARTKFDRTLEMHLVDRKPISVLPAERIRVGKQNGPIEKIIDRGMGSVAPPVTLIIAPVGVGKSTYLKHFELVYGRKMLDKKNTHWIYVDFESMGIGKNVRSFIYEKLRDYLQKTNKHIATDFLAAIKPAYKSEIDSLIKGPLSLLANNQKEIDKIITEHIMKDYEKIEPYVNKVFGHISSNELCILVLDNIDLYEDEELEKTVLSEGLALSKTIFCNVLISIRDTTFVKHKDDSLFNAFELRKFWLDPPPFKEVLSKRLSLSQKILEGKRAKIPFVKGMMLDVPDLSVFFEIVKKSVLSGAAGDFVESMAGLDIRKGISHIKSFLTSGHIHADKALQTYFKISNYDFPFHEIFKGSMLGMWKYYKESRSDCLNVFDSKLSSRRSRLIRLYVLAFLHLNARSEKTAEVSVKNCVDVFSTLGISAEQFMVVMNDLKKFDLIKSTDAKSINIKSIVFLTKTGGYYYKVLITKFPYIEACLYDTAIDDVSVWNILKDLTYKIESERNISDKMILRKNRIEVFTKYINDIEKSDRELVAGSFMDNTERIIKYLDSEIEEIFRSLNKFYPKNKK